MNEESKHMIADGGLIMNIKTFNIDIHVYFLCWKFKYS